MSLFTSLPLEVIYSLPLILALEDFCQVYPLHQFFTSSSPLPSAELLNNTSLASSIHLLSSIITYITLYYTYLSKIHKEFSLIEDLLQPYHEYLYHCNLYLKSCKCTTTPSTSNLFTHLLSVKSGTYEIEILPVDEWLTLQQNNNESTIFSETILMRPLQALDHEELCKILLSSSSSSSPSPFINYKVELEEVACISSSIIFRSFVYNFYFICRPLNKNMYQF